MKIVRHIGKWLLAACTMAAAFSCRDPYADDSVETDRHVMIYYAAGYNDLTPYLKEDIADIAKGSYLPGNTRRGDDVVLVFSKLAVSDVDFSTPVIPVLTRLYRDRNGTTVTDTLRKWDTDLLAATPETFHNVLAYIHDAFPAKDYGLIFSSHSTGWVPIDYYTHPTTKASAARRAPGHPADGDGDGLFKNEDPSLPPVKSVGRDLNGRRGTYTMESEIDMEAFAAAIPFHLDYILFDACLMGGIEMAYALRDKCDRIGFSQTEVLADGFNYGHLAARLVGHGTPDPQAVCEDYFAQYENKSGVWQSATISLVRCDAIEGLTQVCARLFDRYRDAIAALDPAAVQRFGRKHNGYYHNWYFDLRDILVQAGISATETAELDAALDACISYKAHTPGFFIGDPQDSGFEITAFCGLSMYLPAAGNAFLDTYYRSTISWNKVTGLVE